MHSKIPMLSIYEVLLVTIASFKSGWLGPLGNHFLGGIPRTFNVGAPRSVSDPFVSPDVAPWVCISIGIHASHAHTFSPKTFDTVLQISLVWTSTSPIGIQKWAQKTFNIDLQHIGRHPQPVQSVAAAIDGRAASPPSSQSG